MKLKTSSTSPLSAWLEPHPRLEGLALIDHLFNRLDGLYPHKWRSAFANDQAIANWRTAWAEGFSDEGITVDEVREGLKACRRRDWPPSFAEFFKACRPDIDFGAALSEAIDQVVRRDSGDDRWSHPAIFWAAVKVTPFELKNRPRKDLESVWRAALAEQLAKSEWPEIPERRVALPAPGQTHSRDVGNESIREMLSRLKCQAESHFATQEAQETDGGS